MKIRQPVSNPDNWKPFLAEWELHQGYRYLYIVGPGPDAMRRCSRPSWQPAKPKEVKIAERALAILNEHHREDPSAGNDEILAALIACGYKEEKV